MAATLSRPQARAIVHGAAFSVYVQAVRLTLEEKGADYDLHDVNPFAPDGTPKEQFDRHPFGLIPAFEDGQTQLFESEAIARYVDDAYPGPSLQPRDAVARALMSQTVSVLRSYAYPTWVRTLYRERVAKPRRGAPPDEAAILAAVPRARACVHAIAGAMRGGPYLAGESFSLADCFAAPMSACLVESAEGRTILAESPDLLTWWESIRSRDSVRKVVV